MVEVRANTPGAIDGVAKGRMTCIWLGRLNGLAALNMPGFRKFVCHQNLAQ